MQQEICMKMFQIIFYSLLILADARAMKFEEPLDAEILDDQIAEDAVREGCPPEDLVFYRAMWIARKNQEQSRSYHPGPSNQFHRPTSQPSNFGDQINSQAPHHVHMGHGSVMINNYNVYCNFIHPQEFPDDEFSSCSMRRISVAKPRAKPLIPGFCPNCRATESSLWRVFKTSQDNFIVCNACGLRASKGKYCEFCNHIYYDEEVTNKRNWIKCTECDRHAHNECFQEIGDSLYVCDACSSR